jgi:hypothetical protein
MRDLANVEHEGFADHSMGAYADADHILCGSCEDSENAMDYFHSKTSSQSFQAECNVCRNEQSTCMCESETNSTTDAQLTGADKIMQNLRGLLWYWHEYYLRRGRDRLSVEFFAHIPFRYWMELVGIPRIYSLIFSITNNFSNLIIRFAMPR